MPVINTLINPENVQKRGLPVFEVMISGFGGQNGADLIYPDFALPALPSYAGIAIGPRSQADRCWVIWDPLVFINLACAGEAGCELSDFTRRLSVEAPLMFAQTGNKKRGRLSPLAALRVGCDPAAFGQQDVGLDVDILNQFDQGSVRTPSTFLPANTAVAVPLNINAGPNAEGVFSPGPLLHLYFYAQPPAQIPWARFPLTLENIVQPLVGPAETYVAAFPVHGRKYVRLMIATTGTASATFRIGGILPTSSAGVIPKEVTFTTTAAVTATTPVRVALDHPGVDYVTVWYTLGAGAGDATVVMQARDE